MRNVSIKLACYLCSIVGIALIVDACANQLTAQIGGSPGQCMRSTVTPKGVSVVFVVATIPLQQATWSCVGKTDCVTPVAGNCEAVTFPGGTLYKKYTGIQQYGGCSQIPAGGGCGACQIGDQMICASLQYYSGTPCITAVGPLIVFYCDGTGKCY